MSFYSSTKNLVRKLAGIPTSKQIIEAFEWYQRQENPLTCLDVRHGPLYALEERGDVHLRCKDCNFDQTTPMIGVIFSIYRDRNNKKIN